MRFHEFGKGVYPKSKSKPLSGSNISVTGTNIARLQRKHNIKPGTPEWFKLWFSLPRLTGEQPVK